MSKIDEFCSWSEQQVKNHSIYVWGGEGEDHSIISEKWIRSKEPEKSDEERAIKFWEKQVNAGYGKLLRAYDCSGFIRTGLIELGIIPKKPDMSAHTLMGKCKIIPREQLVKGAWSFRVDSKGHCYHIGAVVREDLTIAEAKGREDGCVLRDINASGKSYWNRFGLPTKYFDFDPPIEIKKHVEVIGNTVNIRKEPNTTKNSIVKIAKKGERYPLLIISSSGWYTIEVEGKKAYISSKETLTKIV